MFKTALLLASLLTMSAASAATIDVDTHTHVLTLREDNGSVITYPIATARPGFEWTGTERITRKAEWPTWVPTPAMRKRNPALPKSFPGGYENPMGARGLTLGNTFYLIHGNDDQDSIGHNVSSGCIRMYNIDVIDLFNRVKIGTVVKVH